MTFSENGILLSPISSWQRLEEHSKPKRLTPLVWKRLIEDNISIRNITRDGILQFIEQANKYHPTIKFTAEIPDAETNFLNTNVY